MTTFDLRCSTFQTIPCFIACLASLRPSLNSFSHFFSFVAHPHGAPGVGVRQWTVEQVVSWLDSVGLTQLAPMFARHRMTGDVLLSLSRADVEMMLVEAGIPHPLLVALTVQSRILKLKPLAKAHVDFVRLACNDDAVQEEVDHLHMLNAYRCNGGDCTKEIPLHFICPLTGELMNNPAIASDDSVYERFAIEAWLKVHGTSPMTSKPMSASQLRVNLKLQSDIHAFLRHWRDEIHHEYVRT